MCCGNNQSHHSHADSCGCHSQKEVFWSRKKKLEHLNHYLECLEEKRKDVQEAIKELSAE